MVAHCCRSTQNSKLIYEQGFKSLRWELYMSFSSKYTIFRQVTPNIWPKVEQSGGYSGPSHTRVWLQTAKQALQRQSLFMSEDCKAWDENCRKSFNLITTFSTKPTPSCCQKWVVLRLIWPKLHDWMIKYCCRNSLKLNLVNEKGLQSLWWE